MDYLSTKEDIVKMWRNHFTAKLNCLNKSVNERLVSKQMGSCTLGTLEKVSTNKIKTILRNLPSDKAIRLEEIPKEFYKKSTQLSVEFPRGLLKLCAVTQTRQSRYIRRHFCAYN